MANNNTNKPKAFISCSLREEDKKFNDFIIRIVKKFGFEPFGTVGMYTASPEPPVDLMKQNILEADCVVVAATARYLQEDIHKNNQQKGLSEMLHGEVGMAVMADRPVLVFVEEGVSVGNLIPMTTQYITINPYSQESINRNWGLIANYFRSALTIIEKKWFEEKRDNIIAVTVGILAIIGAAAVINAVVKNNKNKAIDSKSKKELN